MRKIIRPDTMSARPGMQLIDRSELARCVGFSSEGAFVEKAFVLVFKQIWIEAKRRANGNGHQVTDEDLVFAATGILYGNYSTERLQ